MSASDRPIIKLTTKTGVTNVTAKYPTKTLNTLVTELKDLQNTINNLLTSLISASEPGNSNHEDESEGNEDSDDDEDKEIILLENGKTSTSQKRLNSSTAKFPTKKKRCLLRI